MPETAQNSDASGRLQILIFSDASRLTDANYDPFRGEKYKKMEAQTGFEPVDDGFADRSLSHLGTAPLRGY